MKPLILSNEVIKSPPVIIDRLFSIILTTEYSRSVLSTDPPESMSKLLQEYGSKPTVMAAELETLLQRKYLKYFDAVEVDVLTISNDKVRYDLNITMRIVADGKTYDFKESLSYDGGSKEIMRNEKSDA